MHRIVHITTLPQTAASFLRGQLRFFREHGYQVTLMSSPGQQLQEFAAEEGVAHASIKMLRAISPAHDALAVFRLAAQLRVLRPQLVHAHTPKAGLVAMLAARLAGVPCRAYHMHGLKFETATGMRRQLLKRAEQVTCRLANRVYCVSESLKRKAMEEQLFTATQPPRVLAHGSINGLDVDEFTRGLDRSALRERTRNQLGIPARATCLGFVGRLVRDKGIEELATAWSSLRERYPNLHLLLVGPFETQDAVSHHVKRQLESDPRVHLTGLDWNVKPYFSAMDVFTLPSHREGLPYVALEAAAMCLPIVSCRATGCVDAIADGETGLLVDIKDSAALTVAIRRYLDDTRLRQRHGNAARERVRELFAPRAIWQELLTEYAELFESRGLQPPAQQVAPSPTSLGHRDVA